LEVADVVAARSLLLRAVGGGVWATVDSTRDATTAAETKLRSTMMGAADGIGR
jgi:hypothetical protein